MVSNKFGKIECGTRKITERFFRFQDEVRILQGTILPYPVPETEPRTGLRSVERSSKQEAAGNKCPSGAAEVRPTWWGHP